MPSVADDDPAPELDPPTLGFTTEDDGLKDRKCGTVLIVMKKRCTLSAQVKKLVLTR